MVEPKILGILGATLFCSYLFAAWNFRDAGWWAFGPFAGAAVPLLLTLVLWWAAVL